MMCISLYQCVCRYQCVCVYISVCQSISVCAKICNSDYNRLPVRKSGNQMSHPQISLPALETGFTIMSQNRDPQAIGQANRYFNQCQKNPHFSLKLMQLFNESQNETIKKQALGLLRNVTTRNWISKRRSVDLCYLSQQLKNQIKSGLLELYQLHWKLYYKEFNLIFQWIARHDFPLNYPGLNEFINQVLTTLSGLSIEQVLMSQQLLPYLSTIKRILKSYGSRRILNSHDNYQEYLLPIVQKSTNICESITKAVEMLANADQRIEYKLAVNLLECSRKIDKIILYGLESGGTEIQTDYFSMGLLQFEIRKVCTLLNVMKQNNLRVAVQSNIHAIVQLVSKLQGLYPFLFTTFLKDYLQLILNILFNAELDDEKAICAIIRANCRPHSIYAYYSPEKQFAESIYCRKTNNYYSQQSNCHKIYMEVYGGTTCNLILQKTIQQLMIKYHRDVDEDELIFEDTETIPDNNEPHPYDLVLNFLKIFINRWKEQAKEFLVKVYSYLLSQNQPMHSSSLLVAMYQIVIMLPRILDETGLDLNSVYTLMQRNYGIHDYRTFARLIRSYQPLFNLTMVHRSFEILSSIISGENCEPQTIYQCAVCMKKILLEHEQENLPLEQLPNCLTNIFKLFVVYKNVPTHLWNLLNLMGELMKSMSHTTVVSNIPSILQNVSLLISMKDNDILVLNAVTDLLGSIIDILESQDAEGHQQLCYESNRLCIGHIEQSITKIMKSDEQAGLESLHMLWLAVMRNHHALSAPQDFNTKLMQMLEALREHALEETPITFLQILQEYMLSGLLQLSSADLNHMFNSIRQQHIPEHQPRINVILYSLYYTHMLLSNNLIPEIFIQAVKDTMNLYQKISPGDNSLRTQLILVVFTHFIKFGAHHILQLLAQQFDDYRVWFCPLLWSLQYINHRYAHKVIAIAILTSLTVFPDEYLLKVIEGHLPLDQIMKQCVMELQPMSAQQAMNSYSNALRMILHSGQPLRNKFRTLNLKKNVARKIKLHVNSQWVQSDLRELFRQKVAEKMNKWNWSQEDLAQRLSPDIRLKVMEYITP